MRLKCKNASHSVQNQSNGLKEMYFCISFECMGKIYASYMPLYTATHISKCSKDMPFSHNAYTVRETCLNNCHATVFSSHKSE